MINRVILLVIDGLGLGALPDAAAYGDADAHTLVHLAESVGGLTLPNLEMLGLGHLAPVKGIRTMAQPTGCFGRMAFVSPGKNSVVGYWETNGVVLPCGSVPQADGLSAEQRTVLETVLGRKILGGRAAAPSTMLAQYGAEHLAANSPIVWTDGSATCHVAAHQSVMPAADLAQRCREVRKAMRALWPSVRVVAQPLTGDTPALKPAAGRKDLVAEPPGITVLDVLNRSSQIVMGIGKVYDLFSGRGFTRSFPAVSAKAAFDETLGMLSKVPRGLLYVSLDLMPDDLAEATAALEEFDRRLPELLDKVRIGDIVVITSDHGRDLTRPGRLPTREYVPLLVTGPKLAQGVNLGTRATAADLGQTVVDAFRAARLPVGDSFLEALRPG